MEYLAWSRISYDCMCEWHRVFYQSLLIHRWSADKRLSPKTLEVCANEYCRCERFWILRTLPTDNGICRSRLVNLSVVRTRPIGHRLWRVSCSEQRTEDPYTWASIVTLRLRWEAALRVELPLEAPRVRIYALSCIRLTNANEKFTMPDNTNWRWF